MARKTAGIAEADARRAQIMASGAKPAAQPKTTEKEGQGGQMPNIDAGQVMSIINQFSKKGKK